MIISKKRKLDPSKPRKEDNIIFNLSISVQVYVDITFCRCDIATEVCELAFLFQRIEIFIKIHELFCVHAETSTHCSLLGVM